MNFKSYTLRWFAIDYKVPCPHCVLHQHHNVFLVCTAYSVFANSLAKWIYVYMFKAKSVGAGWDGDCILVLQWKINIRIGIEFFVKHVLLLKQGVWFETKNPGFLKSLRIKKAPNRERKGRTGPLKTGFSALGSIRWCVYRLSINDYPLCTLDYWEIGKSPQTFTSFSFSGLIKLLTTLRLWHLAFCQSTLTFMNVTSICWRYNNTSLQTKSIYDAQMLIGKFFYLN